MTYEFILIDSITCESFVEVMHYGDAPYSDALWELQTKSGNKIANKELGLLMITSETKKIIEKKYANGGIPMSLSCLLSACEEIGIISKDEINSIVKASSFLTWKKRDFCILTGNLLLKDKLSSPESNVYELSQAQDILSNL